MSQTHWKKLTNPNYLGAYAIENGQDLIVTIKSVGNEIVTGDGGREEKCTVCHFMEKNIKPMILNKTNMKTIQKLTDTPYVEEWAGHKIAIYIDPKVKFGREITGGIRIRPSSPLQNAVKPKCEICNSDINSAGRMTPDKTAAYTKMKYGQALCSACATKRAQEVKNNAE